MKLRETVYVEAAPLDVWPLVSDPAEMAAWNPKIVSVDRRAGRPIQLGERFRMIYAMSRRERETEVEVTDLRAPERIVFRHCFSQGPARRFADESYELILQGSGTRVVQTIDLRSTGIPWIFAAIIGLIHRAGSSAGPRYLTRLKQLVENGAVPAQSA